MSAGYRNRFGHPHADVLARYRERAVAIYRTDRDGAVIVDLPAQGGVQLRRHRDVYRRYWHDAPARADARLDDDRPTFLH